MSDRSELLRQAEDAKLSARRYALVAIIMSAVTIVASIIPQFWEEGMTRPNYPVIALCAGVLAGSSSQFVTRMWIRWVLIGISFGGSLVAVALLLVTNW